MTRGQKAEFDAGFGPIWQKMEDDKEEARREVYKMELEIEKKQKTEMAKTKRGRPRSEEVSLHDCCSMFREPTVYWHKKKVEKKEEKKEEEKKPKIPRGRGRPRSEEVSLHDCCSMFREPTVYWHKKKVEKKEDKSPEKKAEEKKPKVPRGRGRPRSEEVSLHDCCSMFREPTVYWHKKKVEKQPNKMVSKKPKKVVSKIYTLENNDPFGAMDMMKAAKFGTTDCLALD